MRSVDMMQTMLEEAAQPAPLSESADLTGTFQGMEKESTAEYEKAENALYSRWEKFLGEVNKRAEPLGFRVDSGHSSIRVDVHNNDPSELSGFVGFLATKDSGLTFIDKKDPAVTKAVDALSKGLGLPISFTMKMKNIPVFAFGAEA